MPVLWRAVADHAAPAGDGTGAAVWGGTIALGLGRAGDDFATGSAVDFNGTPGADKTAAGRVSGTAFGAIDLPCAVSAAAWVAVAVLAASVVAALVFELPGEPAG